MSRRLVDYLAGFRLSPSALGCLLCAALGSLPVPAQTADEPVPLPPDYPELRERAEAHYAEGSYALARQIYESLITLELPRDETFWVAYRIHDTNWRDWFASQNRDDARLREARQGLQTLAETVRKAAGPGNRPPELWALIQESLGLSHLLNARHYYSYSQGSAWGFLRQSLDWYAASTDIEIARQRYLDITFALAERDPRAGFGWGWMLPASTLEKTVRIAEGPTEVVRARYYYGVALMREGSPRQRLQAGQVFAEALERAERTDWLDDVLWEFAQWAERFGSNRYDSRNGNLILEPDFERALTLYRQITTRFSQGQSRYLDQAESRIQQLTEPNLQVFAGNAFLPDGLVSLNLIWRNVGQAEVNFYPVDLSAETIENRSDLVSGLALDGVEPVLTLTENLSTDRAHVEGRRTLRLNAQLPAGAYVAEAVSGETRGRSLLLVSDAALLVKTYQRELLAFLADAHSGEPIAEAPVRASFSRYANGNTIYASVKGVTDTQGIARLNFPQGSGWSCHVVAAGPDGRQTFTRNLGGTRNNGKPTRIYAFTDRPAYRPGESAQWKVIVRDWAEDAGWVLPEREAFYYHIQDAQSNVVKEGALRLNAFGSGFAELALDEDFRLGTYTLLLNDAKEANGRYTGRTLRAELFRLEEYKLPEFRVRVATAPGEDGRPQAYRLGDAIDVEVTAEYYFGGGVPDAEVEFVVRENPYYHWWAPRRQYAWYFDDRPSHYAGGGNEVLRETVKTDADGKATLTIDTPFARGNDLRYTIQARVIDASRREIVGQTSVKVTRQPYYVFLRPERNLHQPGEAAEIQVRTETADSLGLPVGGTLILTRQQWTETWLGPNNRTIDGRELDRLVASGQVNREDYARVRQQYVAEPVARQAFQTDDNGDATARFTLTEAGFYKLEWLSFDDRGVPVKAETAFYAADDASQEIGYRGGLEVIADSEAARMGESFPVMVTTPTAGRHVLLTVSANGVMDHQVVRVDGRVKLVRYDVTRAWTPNVFIEAEMFHDLNFQSDFVEVVVPPEDAFLQVAVEPSSEYFEPGAEAAFDITLTDTAGQPVVGEFALSVFDEAILYIQDDLAGDPREVFYGDKRHSGVNTRVSLYDLRFSRETWEDYLRQQGLIGLDSDGEFSSWRWVVTDEGAKARAGAVFADAFAIPAPTLQFESSVVNETILSSSVAQELSPEEDEAAPDGSVDGAGTSPEIIVRSDFRSTAFWAPDFTTDASGQASVTVDLPQNVTTWQALVRALSLSTKVGQGSDTVVTRLPLIARLQAPRFFTVGDEPVLSGVFNNTTERFFSLKPSLEISGDALTLQSPGQPDERIRVEAGQDHRYDWKATAATPGEVTVRLSGVGQRYADAMEQRFEVFEHGIEKFEALSGRLDAASVELSLSLPRHKPDSRTLEVHVTPSLAVTMLDAVPYLVRYPYGCVEQTMSRFLPAVCVAKTLTDLGVDPDDVAGKVFGGLEPDAVPTVMNLNRFAGIEKLNAVTRQSIERLQDFQHSDGGWGWWKTGDSDLFMSAYVVWGLTLAREADVAFNPSMLERGRAFVDRTLIQAENQPDLQAWLLHALAEVKRNAADNRPSTNEATAFANLWEKRDRLNSYTRALLALSAHRFGFEEEAQILARNLRNGVKRDSNPEQSILVRDAQGNRNPAVMATAHWGQGGVYWRWSDGGVESTAFALRALLAIEPDADLVVPVMNWLVKNRRGAQWTNTRDTAIVLLALNEYLQTSGELQSDFTYSLSIDGESVATASVTPATVLQAPSKFSVDPALLKEGANTIVLRRTGGEGPLYFSARAEYFTLEEPITAAGNEIFLHRQYYRVEPVPTLLDGFREQLVPLEDGATVNSGDRIECVLLVEGKNDYEYLIFEDLKPAGLETVAVRSGGAGRPAREVRPGVVDDFLSGRVSPGGAAAYWATNERYTGATRPVYQELRDRHVASFISQLPEGYWEIRYTLRAEVPGTFHGLPAMGHAMYVPEIRANSAETRLTIRDNPDAR
ncbi:MAG: alpha-2-macroglobulin [Opitutales bacterium]